MRDYYFSNQPVDDFEGITPAQMHGLLYTPFDKGLSPMRLNENIDNKFTHEIDYYKHIIQFLSKINEQQPLKLTQKGNLPQKLLRELTDEGLIESEEQRDLFKRHPPRTEIDNFYLHEMKILIQLTGLTMRRYNRISLTKKGKTYLVPEMASELYLKLFMNYVGRYNWGYGDFYPDSWIIQSGFGFSIYLVQKYGTEPRDVNFYAEKFLNAFPNLMVDFPDGQYSNGMKEYKSCYKLRVFERFLHRFGLIEIVKKDRYWQNVIIIKKELMDNFIKWDFENIREKESVFAKLPSVN